jgi:hypothetical protein
MGYRPVTVPVSGHDRKADGVVPGHLSVACVDSTGGADPPAIGMWSSGHPDAPSQPSDSSGCVTVPGVFAFLLSGNHSVQVDNRDQREARNRMSILWIILIVILVLALLGFFSRGRW